MEFGQTFADFPLRHAPHFVYGDALETDWTSLIRPEDCDYVFGNPPFSGAKTQTPAQRAQVRALANLGGSGGTLDYVTAWFLKAGDFVNRPGGKARIGFVATNSITQGEQVAQLWPLLFDRYGLEIAFAHRTFAWTSAARGIAHVHVVVIGLDRAERVPATRRLFTYPTLLGDPVESLHLALSPYLIDAGRMPDPHVVVVETSRPINAAPVIASGSQPIDGKNYIFRTHADLEAFLVQEPHAEPYVRPYVGTKDLVNSRTRWILALQNATPEVLRNLPLVLAKMKAVREYRQTSDRKGTLGIADYPTRYNI